MRKNIKNTLTARIVVGMLAAGAVLSGGAALDVVSAPRSEARIHTVEHRMLSTGWNGRLECWSVNVFTPTWWEFHIEKKNRSVSPGNRVSPILCGKQVALV